MIVFTQVGVDFNNILTTDMKEIHFIFIYYVTVFEVLKYKIVSLKYKIVSLIFFTWPRHARIQKFP